jgi:MYXO-CTERM domain-containing protein
MMRPTTVLLVTAMWLAPATCFAQMPEERGALTVAEWDAGMVSAAGASIRTRVVYPSSGTAPFPLVGVIHGAGRTGSRHIELARTLASRGFVAVLPDMPCTIFACDHDANAAQITALLEWAVAQSATGGSMIAGRVDGSRRGLIGHSWGALASHIASSRDSTIDSLVLFDPNDDGTEGLAATPGITAPTLQLLAQVPGSCNSQWNEAMVTPMLPDPKLQLTVGDSGHCDPEEPGDAICPFGCGAGDASTSSIFRRYAVAWTACVLESDASMADWLGGAQMDADETAMDAGTDADAGIAPDVDSGTPMPGPDGAAGDDDAGASPGIDASATRDAGSGAPSESGGCGCAAPGAPTEDTTAVALLLLLALVVAHRRRR